MNLTDKILMVRPNTFRSNEQTIINNYFQKADSKIDDKDVFTKALKEFDDLTSIISKNNIDLQKFIENCKDINPEKFKRGFDTGLFVNHPLIKDKKLPVFVANFVLKE